MFVNYGKKTDYYALINDTLFYRCGSQQEVVEEITSFLGDDAIYNEQFAKHLIYRWGIEQCDIDNFYSLENE